MGKKKDKESLEQLDGAVGAPRPDPGPLAPWRLSISVAVAAAFTGMPLFDAAMSGVGVDTALLRSFGVAFAVWLATGFVNRILLQAQQAVDADAAAAEPAEVVPTPVPYGDDRTPGVEPGAA